MDKERESRITLVSVLILLVRWWYHQQRENRIMEVVDLEKAVAAKHLAS